MNDRVLPRKNVEWYALLIKMVLRSLFIRPMWSSLSRSLFAPWSSIACFGNDALGSDKAREEVNCCHYDILCCH